MGEAILTRGSDTSSKIDIGSELVTKIITETTQFEVPDGIIGNISIRLFGGGGGAGGMGGGGGGGGNMATSDFNISAGTKILISIGSGGDKSSNGGTTSFGSYLSATGGECGNIYGRGGNGGTGGGAGKTSMYGNGFADGGHGYYGGGGGGAGGVWCTTAEGWGGNGGNGGIYGGGGGGGSHGTTLGVISAPYGGKGGTYGGNGGTGGWRNNYGSNGEIGHAVDAENATSAEGFYMHCLNAMGGLVHGKNYGGGGGGGYGGRGGYAGNNYGAYNSYARSGGGGGGGYGSNGGNGYVGGSEYGAGGGGGGYFHDGADAVFCGNHGCGGGGGGYGPSGYGHGGTCSEPSFFNDNKGNVATLGKSGVCIIQYYKKCIK